MSIYLQWGLPQIEPVPPHPDLPIRLPAEERRRQLLEVAIDLFSRRGFKGTTTKEIAAAAGVTEAIIFRHFANKEQLYTAILDHRYRASESQEWIAVMKQRMDNNDDEGVFRTVIATIIQMVRDDAKFERVMLYAAMEGHDLAAMYHKQFAIPVVALLRDFIARRQAEGALRVYPPKAIIFSLAGMAKQYATHIHMCGYDNAGFSDEEAVDTFTGILMGGICGNAGKAGIV